MGLTELDSNKCRAILHHKAKIFQADKGLGRPHTDATSLKGSGLQNREIDQFGEIAVKRLERSYRRDFSDADIEQIIFGYESGKTTIELAEQFNCSKGTINKLLRQHEVSITKAKAQVKLDVEVVISMYEQRHTIAEIAGHFGVSSYTINRCLRSNDVKIRSRWDYVKK